MSKQKDSNRVRARAPLRWQAILFAFALNLFLATLSTYLATPFPVVAICLVALLAGSLTAFFVGQRGGIHAFIGGMASVVLLGLYVLPGQWQPALLAGAFCTLGGAITEIVIRNFLIRRQNR
jgi:hypothetical protein